MIKNLFWLLVADVLQKTLFLELRYFLKITLVLIEAFFVDLCYNIKNQTIINHAFLRRDIMKGIV